MPEKGPVIGVGVVVMKGAAVLLIRRAHPPRAGSWSLPGGKQKLGETIEQAMRRELAEETGLIDIALLGLADVVDLLDRGEDGALRFHYTVVDFAADWRSGEVCAGDDATDAAWVTPDQFDAYDVTHQARAVIAKAKSLRDTAASI